MKNLSSIVAFLSGIALYSVVVYVGGYLSAIAVPNAYFEYFGADHKLLALFVLEAVSFALPCFALSIIWSWLTLRWLSKTSVMLAAKFCLAGIALTWLFWQISFVIETLNTPEPVSILGLVLMAVIPPVWAVMNVVVVPLGLGVALWIVVRENSRPVELM